MVRANPEELKIMNSKIIINGLKLIVTCSMCGRKWAIWFSGEQDLSSNLPKDWYMCFTCDRDKE